MYESPKGIKNQVTYRGFQENFQAFPRERNSLFFQVIHILKHSGALHEIALFPPLENRSMEQKSSREDGASITKASGNSDPSTQGDQTLQLNTVNVMLTNARKPGMFHA